MRIVGSIARASVLFAVIFIDLRTVTRHVGPDVIFVAVPISQEPVQTSVSFSSSSRWELPLLTGAVLHVASVDDQMDASDRLHYVDETRG